MNSDKEIAEHILCSAIYFNDQKEYVHQPRNITIGYVICGLRHHNCFQVVSMLKGLRKDRDSIEEIQGFLTSKNRFVDRIEAGEIAFKAGQTKTLIKSLHSEDLW